MIALLLAISVTTSARAVTFDDIQFWVGAGSNRAAFIVDWRDDIDPAINPESLLWGYQWDGDANIEQMVRAVAAADDRFFATLGAEGAFGTPVFGFGYDIDNDGFAIENSASMTRFDAADFIDGVLQVATGEVDGFDADDADDHYEAGWFNGFWGLWTADASPFDGGAWMLRDTGIRDTMIADGLWTGVVWDPDFSTFGPNPPMPDEPTAALPPGAGGVVPEPATGVLGWIGLAALVRRRRGRANV
jgi:hypothetical protein